MPKYTAPGTENIRGNQKIKAGGEWEEAKSSGEPVGGRQNFRANASIKTNEWRNTSKGDNANHIDTYTFTDSKV